jgi:hypothetical protein
MWKHVVALVVAAGIITGGLYLYKNRHRLFRPDFSRSGGTLLVFEVDGEPPDEGLDPLVAVLHKRFDPTDSAGIVVRLNEEQQIEVGVPNGKHHDEQVEMVKRLVGQRGVLDVGWPADDNDEEACAAARRQIQEGNKSGELDKALKRGEPPAAPRNKAGEREFSTKDGRLASYRWVAFDSILSADLTSMASANPLLEARIRECIKRREAFATSEPEFAELLNCSALFFAYRPTGATAGVVYFVLIQEVEAELRLTNEHVERARIGWDEMFGVEAVHVRLRAEGRRRWGTLLRQVEQRGSHQRPPAILVDEKVIAFERFFDAPVNREMVIGQRFSRQDREDLARLLDGGSLPVPIKPVAVRESLVAGRR